MTAYPITEDEARHRFVEEVDALNLRSQAEGPDPASAARMKAIIADHERKCATLLSAERHPKPETGTTKLLRT